MKKSKIFEGSNSTKLVKLMSNNSSIEGKVEAELTAKYGSEYKEKFGSDDFADIFYELDKHKTPNDPSKFDKWIVGQVRRLEKDHPEIVENLLKSNG